MGLEYLNTLNIKRTRNDKLDVGSTFGLVLNLVQIQVQVHCIYLNKIWVMYIDFILEEPNT